MSGAVRAPGPAGWDDVEATGEPPLYTDGRGDQSDAVTRRGIEDLQWGAAADGTEHGAPAAVAPVTPAS